MSSIYGIIPEMKKILFVTDTWSPQVNGVVTVTESLRNHLIARGYDVPLIEPGQFLSVPLRHSSDVEIAVLPGRRVTKLINEIRPDAIHIMTEGPIGHAARHWCIKHDFPFTATFHTNLQLYTSPFLEPIASPIAYRLLSRFHSKSRATFVATETLRDDLASHSFKNLVVVPLGVDTDRFQRTATSNDTLTHPVFICMGRVALEKSPEEFLKLSLPGTKVVIGDGDLRTSLQKKYPEVVFTGTLRGPELVEWMSRGDVLVCPSRTETFGLVLIEALAVGMPVAAHDCMGPRQIITDGVDGYLREDLQSAAIDALTLSRDAARNKALQFSWTHATDIFLSRLVFATV